MTSHMSHAAIHANDLMHSGRACWLIRCTHSYVKYDSEC